MSDATGLAEALLGLDGFRATGRALRPTCRHASHPARRVRTHLEENAGYRIRKVMLKGAERLDGSRVAQAIKRRSGRLPTHD